MFCQTTGTASINRTRFMSTVHISLQKAAVVHNSVEIAEVRDSEASLSKGHTSYGNIPASTQARCWDGR